MPENTLEEGARGRIHGHPLRLGLDAGLPWSWPWLSIWIRWWP